MLARGEGGEERKVKVPGGFLSGKPRRAFTDVSSKSVLCHTKKSGGKRKRKKKGTFGDEIPRRDLANRGS